MTDRLLSVREAAGQLGVSERTVCRLLTAGELPRVKIGRRTLIAPQDVRAFVHRRRGGEESREAQVTDGQLRALHAKTGALDRLTHQERGSWKRAVLAETAVRFGRELEHANDLTAAEASWLLDRLEEELASR